MSSFNLNIDSYSSKELQKLFSLKEKFTTDQLQKAKDKLTIQLTKNKSLDTEKKREISFFLDTACDKLKNCYPKDPSTDKGTWSEKVNPIEEYGSNIIITNANTIAGKKANIVDGRMAETADASPGYINPINVRTIMQPMSIDSRFRSNYYTTTSSNFSVILPETQRKVISMRIASVEMPMTYYAISERYGNTTFLIIGDPSGLDISDTPIPWDNTSRNYVNENGVTNSNFSPVQPAWLATLSEGNYEVRFLDKSYAYHIDDAINDAISLAIPGAIDNMGNFAREAAPGTPPSIGYLNQGVPIGLATKPASDASYADLRYTVDRISGRSIFASPAYSSVLVDTSGGTPFLPTGNYVNRKKIVALRFNVGKFGNLDMGSNIQLKLGWQLGFRVAQYHMGKGSYSDINGALKLCRNDISGVPVSAVSEGICFPTGPRYAFLSIDDHQNSSGPSFIVAYANSTLDDNIISRINLSAVMDSTGVYKDSDDPGVSTQLNRTREYFGPVNIQKLDIKLYDEYGRILDLTNMDWSFSLSFEKLYD